MILFAALSCNNSDKSTEEKKVPESSGWQNKIAFDLSQIRPDGLTGPPDGLVSVSYEFCIPNDKPFLDEVLSIDPAIKFMMEARGRIGCGKTEVLCIGDTHNPRWKDILQEIASLDYVARIERTVWE